jgi:hypothetical protein
LFGTREPGFLTAGDVAGPAVNTHINRKERMK